MTISWVLWIVLDRDVPEGQSLPEPEPVLDYLKVAIKSPGVWLISAGVGFGLASTTAYAGFLPQALQLGKGIDVATAGFILRNCYRWQLFRLHRGACVLR